MSEHPDPNTLHPELRQQSRPKLLIVEDDESTRTQMKWALAQDYEVLPAEDRPSALSLFKKERPHVVTLDLGLPPRPGEVEEGFLALGEILEQDRFAKVIIITGQHEKENGLKAIGDGAYDFFSKPISIEELKVVLNRAFHVSQLERENHELQQRLANGSFEGMVGASPQMEKVFATVRKVATSDIPVLITGDSGTGKELVARAIHHQSMQKNGPFVPINCGAIPENLIESELFGHEKGSFTGAHAQRKGRVEMAQAGTLFLDEIAELPPPMQVKLLRFLQEQTVERVGGRQEIRVDTRVLAATNRDLNEAMKKGAFREDLYFRISAITIHLPPLREREGDILLLSRAFFNRYARENNDGPKGFSREALSALENYSWPGNVRELENKIRRGVVMAEGTKITPKDLELEDGEQKPTIGLKEAREALDRQMVLGALARNQDNMTRAAEELGISRPTLYELMEKLGIGKK